MIPVTNDERATVDEIVRKANRELHMGGVKLLRCVQCGEHPWLLWDDWLRCACELNGSPLVYPDPLSWNAVQSRPGRMVVIDDEPRSPIVLAAVIVCVVVVVAIALTALLASCT